MIDDTKQNKIEGIKDKKQIKEVIGIFFFNIWWLLKEPFCWWFLKNSVVPLAIFPDSPPLVEGKLLYKPCGFVDPFFHSCISRGAIFRLQIRS